MQTKASLQQPGGFYFLPSGDSLNGRTVFDLPIFTQHIQPSARNTKAAKNINNKASGCPSEHLRAGSHGFPPVPSLGSWEPDSDHITRASLSNHNGLVLFNMESGGLCSKRDDLGHPAEIGWTGLRLAHLVTGLINVQNNDRVFLCWILLKGSCIQFF